MAAGRYGDGAAATPEVWCRNPPEGTPAGRPADERQFVAMLIAMLEEAFDFELSRAIFEVIAAAGLAPLVIKTQVAVLDQPDDKQRHTAMHVLFASEIDRRFLGTKLQLIQTKDPSPPNRAMASRMLTHLIEPA